MEEDVLQLSGIQHFAFCRRQWALIHIEQQWAENVRTVEGNLFHRRAHDAEKTEMRGNILTVRGLHIHSARLGVSGICDVVEFYRNEDNGVSLAGYEGKWSPYPIEYKRGAPKENKADELQLCGQALCLEEMLMCTIHEGSLFYGETRRRQRVIFTDELRSETESMLREMRQYFNRGYTPKVRRSKACNACSLKELCLPVLNRAGVVAEYIAEHIESVDSEREVQE